MNINLNPGTYIITANYNGLMASNTIKVLPVLSAKDINKIVNRVTDKYPNCWNNKYVSSLPFVFKLYIKVLKHKHFRKIVCFLLKRFNKYMSL